MIYPEEIVIQELMWEYDYTLTQAQSIVNLYKSKDEYSELCELIQHRLSIKLSREELCSMTIGESDV